MLLANVIKFNFTYRSKRFHLDDISINGMLQTLPGISLSPQYNFNVFNTNTIIKIIFIAHILIIVILMTMLVF